MRTHTAVIGAGQAGLATSAALAARGIDHVVLERGRVANAWRTERWDSFRLLTPNWMTRLPGHRYSGPDPEGYMTTNELLGFFDEYATSIQAPVEEQTTVQSVRRDDEHFTVRTDRGRWTADNVVVASGANAEPHVPEYAATLPNDVAQIAPTSYRNPAQLPDGGVLVVGASASGAQLASELRASGREVLLAVGRHRRLPRRYRGRDIMWWLDRAGVLEDRAANIRDLVAARSQPSLQLTGASPARDLDLAALQRDGVRCTGRLLGVDGTQLLFADDLRENIDDAEHRLAAILDRVDALADAMGAAKEPRPVPVHVPKTPAGVDLRAERITSVVWATGFTRSYPWLALPVLDARGDIRQHEGRTAVAGLFTIGMRFQRVRKSSWLDGVGGDAIQLADHIADNRCVRAAA
jgi:putative flavoprotein involved in K+ transport